MSSPDFRIPHHDDACEDLIIPTPQADQTNEECYRITMSKDRTIAQHLIDSAIEIAEIIGRARVLVFLDGLPENHEDLSDRFILATRGSEQHSVGKQLKKQHHLDLLDVPDVSLDRAGQMNLAALLALSNGIIKSEDCVVALAGPKGKSIDTLQIIRPDKATMLLDAMGGQRSKKAIRRVVFQKVVDLALQLASEGREGRAVGATFVIGDADKVQHHTEQLIMNPFRGYPEDARNILDGKLVDTVKEFSTIDGAFIIRGDGVVLSAGTLLRASLVDEDLPKGLGARHAAAAGITRVAKAIAITISESDGTVRIWRNGKIITTLEKESR